MSKLNSEDLRSNRSYGPTHIQRDSRHLVTPTSTFPPLCNCHSSVRIKLYFRRLTPKCQLQKQLSNLAQTQRNVFLCGANPALTAWVPPAATAPPPPAPSTLHFSRSKPSRAPGGRAAVWSARENSTRVRNCARLSSTTAGAPPDFHGKMIFQGNV